MRKKEEKERRKSDLSKRFGLIAMLLNSEREREKKKKQKKRKEGKYNLYFNCDQVN